jgi:hypothetical protein
MRAPAKFRSKPKSQRGLSLFLWVGLVTAGRLIGYWDVPDRFGRSTKELPARSKHGCGESQPRTRRSRRTSGFRWRHARR